MAKMMIVVTLAFARKFDPDENSIPTLQLQA